jgi:hypothetical protein
MVRIDNKVFYLHDLITVLLMIIEPIKMKEIQLKRLDISLDTDENIQTKFKVMYDDAELKFKDSRIYVNGTGHKDGYTRIGGDSNGKVMISMYNKTMEAIKTHKEYIRSKHREVFGYTTVYRIEVKLFSRILKRLDLDIFSLNNPATLEQLFTAFVDDRIHFISRGSKEKVRFLPLTQSSLVLKKDRAPRTKIGGKKEKEVINYLLSKVAVKGFNQSKGAIDTVIANIVKEYGLEDWYNLKYCRNNQNMSTI